MRALRKARGFSQEAFAAAAGLDRAYYGGVERGERNVAALNLIRIASCLSVEVGELFPPLANLDALAGGRYPTERKPYQLHVHDKDD
ncbi:transcriptional regulator [Alkalilimnicola ehrlichii]|uniref:Transcriptional regulator n=1 Tax=Alkalilimnicola ehrlichii TaxID=351052 RepID=A0A3E0WH83_9GAMM|nr:transcriptional regulator [Alkalilimnicola ehrlichii]RFA31809.1 transcriptional regulator [Alkalilimnicola ehrlichii]